MHVDQEQLERYVDDELTPDDGGAVRGHIADCAECAEMARQVRRRRDELHGVLRAVDHSVPAVTAQQLMSRARTHPSPWLRRAAGIAIALAVAGAAYAAPGSPVRGWLRAIARVETGRVAPASPRAAQRGETGRQAGIAVDPGTGLSIRFATAQPAGVAYVALTDSPRVEVRAALGAATFASAEDELIIGNRHSSGDFVIELPRSAPRVEIRVAGRRVLLLEHGRITTATEADSLGRFAVSLTSDPR